MDQYQEKKKKLHLLQVMRKFKITEQQRKTKHLSMQYELTGIRNVRDFNLQEHSDVVFKHNVFSFLHNQNSQNATQVSIVSNPVEASEKLCIVNTQDNNLELNQRSGSSDDKNSFSEF